MFTKTVFCYPLRSAAGTAFGFLLYWRGDWAFCVANLDMQRLLAKYQREGMEEVITMDHGAPWFIDKAVQDCERRYQPNVPAWLRVGRGN